MVTVTLSLRAWPVKKGSYSSKTGANNGIEEGEHLLREKVSFEFW